MISGKTIAITRSKDDAQEFIDLASKDNAIPLPIPTIELMPKGDKIVDDFLNDVKEFQPDYSVFMSSKAVKLLFDVAKSANKYSQLQLAIANTMVMAVGPKTKQALEDEGIKVSFMPSKFSSVGVGEQFTKMNAEGKKVIVPRSGASTEFLAKLLEKIGLVVKENHLYDVQAFSDHTQWKSFKELFSQNKIDGIVFTSASSVRGFFEIMAYFDNKDLLKKLEKIQIVAIGPFTAEELKKFNIEPKTADVHTVPGAFEAMKNIFSLA
ncbi:MAG: uroporphyrinogen-III synthase [Nitrososphaeria archaeon]|nr:uroporphyrinogen-III synthase [Nitrososphaeria archaeon]NDB50963.1 uroporphyrinogen-III synthase [Nitrosopumilaceae archaeon]NDB87317.1 uroporphyrinogen-III synthase [Nitrososphaerota archaeon]NDB45845.1 uroporphyrinogen-III synthase [Nitrososphaeria archaeon]NDB63146.1 uroporphyrinogen-III synthase [Nitrosopumilaceae archaeon]